MLDESTNRLEFPTNASLLDFYHYGDETQRRFLDDSVPSTNLLMDLPLSPVRNHSYCIQFELSI